MGKVICIIREKSLLEEIKDELIGIFYWIVVPTTVDVALLYFLFPLFKK